MKTFGLLSLVVLALLVAVAKGDDLIIVENAIASGAVCLDGTAPGYYFRAGSGNHANSWVIFFEGGGWCYDEDDCLGRAGTSLGSSKYWSNTTSSGGIMNSDPSANPYFYDFNIAFFKYCDGASFSGNADAPAVVNGTTIYFRGHRVLNALLGDLVTRGLMEATEILVTGCSAGGLSTYLHADYITEFVSVEGIPVKAFGGSGYFMDTPNENAIPVYMNQMQYVFKMQNCSGGVNRHCVNYYAPQDQWKCMFARYTYEHIETPFLVVNSPYDQWQMGNVLFVDVNNASNCVNNGPSQCNPTQIQVSNAFATNLTNSVIQAGTSVRPGNGLFLFSCWNHCAESNDIWMTIEVDGVSIAKGVYLWYYQLSGSDPSAYVWQDCTLNPGNPGDCNPTCEGGNVLASTLPRGSDW